MDIFPEWGFTVLTFYKSSLMGACICPLAPPLPKEHLVELGLSDDRSLVIYLIKFLEEKEFCRCDRRF